MEGTIPRILRDIVRGYPGIPALLEKDGRGVFRPRSYAQVWDETLLLAAGLAGLGVGRGERIGIIADNRSEWMLADRAILCLGAADVPRGCDSTEAEIAFILSFSECRLSFLENRRQLDKIISSKAALPRLKTVILFDPPAEEDEGAASEAGLRLLSMGALAEAGRSFAEKHPGYVEREIDAGSPEETATVIFTSGTTGDPKGVMLSHRNFACQLEAVSGIIPFAPGQSWLSILPIWHVFNRLLEYVAMSQANTVAYSKPMAAVMLPDLQAVKPHWIGSVPRVWEALMEGVEKAIAKSGAATRALFAFFLAIGRAHSFFRGLFLGFRPSFDRLPGPLLAAAAALPFLLLAPLAALGDLLAFRKIKARLGGRFLAGLSGGGSLPGRVDRFFRALGVLLLDGYGLTEAAPALAFRLLRHPVWETAGPALAGAEIKILGEEGEELGPGLKGAIFARGPQVMQGYLKRPDLSAAVLSPDGWLDTGDLGMLTRRGELKITGRAKDTIVLSGGENVEPGPIERKLSESPYILQACVVGQDRRFLGALIVPREDALRAFAAGKGWAEADYPGLLARPETAKLIASELAALVSHRNGFKPFERVVRFALLPAPFSSGRELSLKLDLARHRVQEIHAAAIEALFAR